MNSCLYEGRVQHTRYRPVDHIFTYTMFQMYLDLEELDEVFRGRWCWSTGRFAPARFLRSDHLGDPKVPLAEAVRGLVESQCGLRPEGPIRLLTHLRYFGYYMNPVSFYYCFEPAGEKLDFVVAEINNTPWGEQFNYAVDLRASKDGGALHRFQKQFHVSPFMSMDLDYAWKFNTPGHTLSVYMENLNGSERVFDATLMLRRIPLSTSALTRMLTAYPLMTVKVVSAIYWQALQLWMKRAPFHSHPKYQKRPEN